MNFQKLKSEEKALWQASLACFIIAALTGVFFRLGMIGYLPGGLGLDNIRHAHSHLMFFGWAVPFPMLILLHRIRSSHPQKSSGILWMRYSIWACLAFGLLAYPFFLLYGYRPVPVGPVTLPLSVIFSGLVMISWYGFITGYIRLRSRLDNKITQSWYDASLMMLFISSFGAWGVAAVQALAPSNYLFMKSLTHFFLATFTEGWVVLVVLGILLDQLKPVKKSWKLSANISIACIALGAPLTFSYGISQSLLTPTMLTVARIGGLITALGVANVLYAIWIDGKWKERSPVWKWPLILLGIKALMQFGASIIPTSFWLSDHALRVLYLHILLLGVFTLVSAGWLHVHYKVAQKYFNLILLSVLAVLFSLVLPTSLLPEMWRGNWIFYTLAVVAMAPPLAFTTYWINILNIRLR